MSSSSNGGYSFPRNQWKNTILLNDSKYSSDTGSRSSCGGINRDRITTSYGSPFVSSRTLSSSSRNRSYLNGSLGNNLATYSSSGVSKAIAVASSNGTTLSPSRLKLYSSSRNIDNILTRTTATTTTTTTTTTSTSTSTTNTSSNSSSNDFGSKYLSTSRTAGTLPQQASSSSSSSLSYKLNGIRRLWTPSSSTSSSNSSSKAATASTVDGSNVNNGFIGTSSSGYQRSAAALYSSRYYPIASTAATTSNNNNKDNNNNKINSFEKVIGPLNDYTTKHLGTTFPLISRRSASVSSRRSPASSSDGADWINGGTSSSRRSFSSSRCLSPTMTTTCGGGKENGETVGLCNLSNTCYMNVVIQCLAHTSDLRRYILNRNYERTVPTAAEQLFDHDLLLKSFADLIRQIWTSSTSRCIYPKKFHSVFGSLVPKFDNALQHDACEFLDSLIEQMNARLMMKNSSIGGRGRSSSTSSSTRWRYNNNNNDDDDENNNVNNELTNMFMGKYNNTIVCDSCRRTVSESSDPFWTVILSMPNNGGVYSIEQLLKSYTEEEKIVANCDRCSRKCANMSKRLQFQRLPKYLIIRLNRSLSTVNSDTVNIERSTTLDMKQFVNINNNNNGYNIAYKKYRLYAIIQYQGISSRGGHYFAFCKSPDSNSWYRCNDTIVTSGCNSYTKYGDSVCALFYEAV